MLFVSVDQLNKLIVAYFKHIAGKFHLEIIPGKGKNADEVFHQKVWDHPPEPATISGLALYLGFESRASFEEYERTGEFATALKRARLRVEAEYEKTLLGSTSGAIFALKNLGWLDRETGLANDVPDGQNMYIRILDTGIAVVNSERDVEI
jgi:hypothetical protein